VETTPLTRDGVIDLIAQRDDDIGVETTLYIQEPIAKYKKTNGINRQPRHELQ
jgi:hypothetical protein